MNPDLYRSIMSGTDVADLEKHEAVLETQHTPNGNTILHVAAQFGQLEYVKSVLAKCPSLLRNRNIKDETPLHMAAREGQAEIVKALIDRAKELETQDLEGGWRGAVKEMLRAINVDGDTALHMAARNCHLAEAKFSKLVEALRKGLKKCSDEEEEKLEKIMRESDVGRDRALLLLTAKNLLRKEYRDVYLEVLKILSTKAAEFEHFPKTKVDRGTALYVVARSVPGIKEYRDKYYCEAVKLLTQKVDRETAVLMAARYLLQEEYRENYLEVVKLLSEEDAEFEHPPNKFQETPLYLAAERGYMGVAIVEALVTNCRLPSYSGPDGRTALHAAALNDTTGQSTKKMLKWQKDLINQADGHGWTPFHYAACNENWNAVEELLAMDISVAYIVAHKETRKVVKEPLAREKSGDDINTPSKDSLDIAIHIAAAHGHVEVIEKLLSYNPDCWEILNSKGQNVLHIAVDLNRESVIRFIVNQPWVGHLINQKDDEGNTPLHLLATSDCGVHDLWKHHRADRQAFNTKNMAPIDLAWSKLRKRRASDSKNMTSTDSMWYMKEKRISTFTRYILDDNILALGITGGRNIACNADENLAKLEKVGRREKQRRKEDENAENQRIAKNAKVFFQTLMIVAALIANITFAAAFTVPGGYDASEGSNQGAALLAGAATFEAFIITNTIAMICSVISMVLCITGLWYAHDGKINTNNLARYRIQAVMILMSISLSTMMLAFIVATFATLPHSIALAVATCILSCITFIAYIWEWEEWIRQGK